MPAFLHDWSFPITAVQLRGSALEYAHPWLSTNFGLPNFYAFGYPLAGMEAVLSFVLSPHAVLVTVLAIAIVAGASGVGACVGQIVPSATAFGRIAGGLAFVFSPYLIDAIVAGHIAEVLACGAMPWALVSIARILEHGRLTDAAYAACAIAVAASQPQFALFLALAVFGGAALRPRRAAPLAAVLALLAIGEAGTLVATFLESPSNAIAADRVTIHWEQLQSATFGDALAQLGYFARYAERAYGTRLPIDRVLLHLVAVVAAIALSWSAIARRNALAALLAGLGILGAGMAVGLDGWFAAPLTFAFRTIPDASFVRELHHWTGLTALAASAGFGCAAALAGGRSRAASTFAIVVACAVLACLAEPYAAGRVWSQVPRLDAVHVASFERALAAIERVSPDGRVLMQPSIQPLRLRTGDSAGPDLEAYPFDGHAIVGAFQPIAPVAALDAAVRGTGAARARALTRDGIAFVVVRTDFVPARLPMFEPALRPITSHCDAAPLDLRALAADPNLRSIYADALIEVYAVGAPRSSSTEVARVTAALPAPSVETDDPRLDWVSGTRWADCFDGLAGTEGASLFTAASRSLTLHLPAGHWQIPIYAPFGASVRDSRGSHAILSSNFRDQPVAGPDVTIAMNRFGAVAAPERLVDPATPADAYPAFASELREVPGSEHVSVAGTFPDLWQTSTKALVLSPRGTLLGIAIALQVLPWLIAAFLSAPAVGTGVAGIAALTRRSRRNGLRSPATRKRSP